MLGLVLFNTNALKASNAYEANQNNRSLISIG